MTLVHQEMHPLLPLPRPQTGTFSSKLGEHRVQSQQKQKCALLLSSPEPSPCPRLPLSCSIRLCNLHSHQAEGGLCLPSWVFTRELASTSPPVLFSQAQYLPPGVHGPAGAHVPAQHPRHQAAVPALRHGAVLQRGHWRGRPGEQHPPDPVHHPHRALRPEHVSTARLGAARADPRVPLPDKLSCLFCSRSS